MKIVDLTLVNLSFLHLLPPRVVLLVKILNFH